MGHSTWVAIDKLGRDPHLRPTPTWSLAGPCTAQVNVMVVSLYMVRNLTFFAETRRKTPIPTNLVECEAESSSVFGIKVDLDNAGLRYRRFQQLDEVDGADLQHVAAAVDVPSAVY